MSEPDALSPARSPDPTTRSAGRRFVVGYGIILAMAGLILAAEPEHSRPWRSLGVAAAVIGLTCVSAPLAGHRGRPRSQPAATADIVGPGTVRTDAAAGVPIGVDETARSAEHAQLDRRATELAAAQVRLDLAAAELAVEQGRLDERNAALRVEQNALDAEVADLAVRRHALHGGRP